MEDSQVLLVVCWKRGRRLMLTVTMTETMVIITFAIADMMALMPPPMADTTDPWIHGWETGIHSYRQQSKLTIVIDLIEMCYTMINEEEKMESLVCCFCLKLWEVVGCNYGRLTEPTFIYPCEPDFAVFWRWRSHTSKWIERVSWSNSSVAVNQGATYPRPGGTKRGHDGIY